MEVIGIMLFIGCGALWLALNKSYCNDLISPFNLLMFFWILPLAFSMLKLSGLQGDLSLEAAIIFATSTVEMAVVSWVALWAIRRGSSHHVVSLSRAEVPSRFALIYILIFYAVAFLVNFYLELLHGIPLLNYLSDAAEGGKGYRHAKGSSLQIIAQVLPVAAMFLLYHLLLHPPKVLVVRVICWALVAFVPLNGIMIVSKSDVFIPLLGYVGIIYYSYHLKRKIFPWLKLVGFVSLMGGLLGWITHVRITGVEGVSDALSYARIIQFKYPDLPFGLSEVFALLYGYAPLNFENFNRYLSVATEEYRFGSSVMHPFLSAMMQGRVVDEMLSGLNKNYVSTASTVGTILRDIYVEGGPYWVFLSVFLYSLLVNLIYFGFRQRGSFTLMMVYLGFLYPWVWMFFTNAFSNLTTFTNIFFVFILAQLYYKKNGTSHVSAFG